MTDRVVRPPLQPPIEIMEHRRSLPLEHWGLERWPFRAVPETDQFYPTAGHSEALARIEYLVDGRRRMGVVLGEMGVGKSLLLQAAARHLARQGSAVVLLDATGLSTRELAWQLACGLGAAPREDAEAFRLWRQIADRLVENRLQQASTVLLVDEAGLAGPDVMTQLVRLARLDPAPAGRWTIVLAAEPAQAARWNDSLRNLVDLRIDLVPWSCEDTIGYVQTALVEAGRLEPLFDEDALAALHDLTGGVARQVARLADFALLAGAAAKLSCIDAATIEAAHEEIAWPTAAAY
jgi:type II secretory pathway predicted ATPase ExeA